LKAATLALAAILLSAGVSFAQQQVNLTAATDDHNVARRHHCSHVGLQLRHSGSYQYRSRRSLCRVESCGPGNSPLVPRSDHSSHGADLQINLTNSLSFTPTGGTTPYKIPTSLVIVGQLGGGLGTPGTGCTSGATCTTSPDHSNDPASDMADRRQRAGRGASWCVGTPPTQGNRVQSFATEVAAGTTASLTFGTATNPLKPGTYLIESGTHPSIQAPMGLYGILVVTTAPAARVAGTAYPAVAATATTAAVPAVTYNAEIPLLLR